MGTIHDLFDDASNAWANRETYAAWLQLTADEGLVHTAYATLSLVAMVEGDVSSAQAGESLHGLLERFLDELDDAGLTDEHRALCAELGSRWRIDWTAIGAWFLSHEAVAA